MALAIHLVNTPKSGVRQAYLDAWREIDARGLRHPDGRVLHVSWTVGDVLHVVDVWDSAEQQQLFLRDLGPILDEFDMVIEPGPQVGEFLQVVTPPV